MAPSQPTFGKTVATWAIAFGLLLGITLLTTLVAGLATGLFLGILFLTFKFLGIL